MSNDLMRFSVAVPEDLLAQFDQLVSRRGIHKNRSEVVRDLIRGALVQEECELPGVEVMGSLTIVYDHHANDLRDRLHGIQHDYFSNIMATTHVHVDHHTCLEVIVLRGETEVVQEVSNRILGLKGVMTGSLSLAAIHDFGDRGHNHGHNHDHDHAHGHDHEHGHSHGHVHE